MAKTNTQALSIETEGIDIHYRFRPCDEVFFLTERGIKSERVIRVRSEIRSLLTTGYRPDIHITYIMADGTERDASEVYASRDELKSSL